MVTAATSKLLLRKKEYRNLGQSKEITAANGDAVVEIDLSFNALDNVSAIEKFKNLKVLILDHNNIGNLRSFPALPLLETLSLAYNTCRDLDSTLIHITKSVSDHFFRLTISFIVPTTEASQPDKEPNQSHVRWPVRQV